MGEGIISGSVGGGGGRDTKCNRIAPEAYTCSIDVETRSSIKHVHEDIRVHPEQSVILSEISDGSWWDSNPSHTAF